MSMQPSVAPNHVELDKLQAGLFYLMTQYSFSNSPAVAAEIVDYVNRLLRHPHIELLPAQQAMLSGLLNRWRIHRTDSPPPLADKRDNR